MAKVKILGIKESTSKTTGKKAYNYFYAEPFSDYEVANSDLAVGVKTGHEYSVKKFDVKPGDEVHLIYEKGFQDKATLSDMLPVKK